MTLRATESEFKLIRDLIQKRCGILLGDEKQYLIENRLAGLAQESGCASFGDFYLQMKGCSPSAKLWSAVVDAMTTNETSWLRDLHPFRILKECLLPRFREEIMAGQRDSIRIWSAACSTGQEPYSIAMTALDYYQTNGGREACHEQVRVLATEISSAALSTAKAGIYDNGSILRGLPSENLGRYFKNKDDFWVVDESPRQMVTFRQINLQEPITNLGQFDIVFLRNVIIYFSDAFKEELLNRIARLLSPGGYLFLGTGETVLGYTSAFDPIEHNGAIYYQVVSPKTTSFEVNHDQDKRTYR